MYIMTQKTAEKSIDTKKFNREDGTKLPQYVAATSASFAAFSTGNVLGWTSQISPQLLDGKYGFPISQDQLGWIGSLTPLGAAFLSLTIGISCDFIGRKRTKLLMVIPLVVGWGLILWATCVEMLYAGRFLTGMVGGAFLVTSPLYCHEISQKEIRGSLGGLTQIMINLGLLFSVILGKYAPIETYTLCCFIVPFVFAVIFLFMPESPVYYLKKNREEESRRVLKILRGSNYDIEHEISELKDGLKKDQRIGNVLKIVEAALKKRSTMMAFFITVGLTTFRFLSGIDSITAYTSYIFKSVTEDFDPEIGPIIMVGLQVIFGIVQSAVVDKIGRKILLLSSQITIVLGLMGVGVCFLLKNRNLIDESSLEIVNFIPLVSLAIFSVGFAMGVAPIPLMLNAEINPQETKSLVTSFNIFFGWMLGFVVTKTFLLIEEGTGEEGAFFIYGGISLVGVFFAAVFVPETKGKTPEEIQSILDKK